MAAMIGAPFISLYLLEVVNMDLFRVIMLWGVFWIGGAVLSPRLGQWIDRFGQRPVLILCVAFKSSNMLALLFCPRDPMAAFWMLAPVFALDAFLNAGIAIANNGFLIKNSPREDRTMFVAAGTAYAGLVGGVTSIAAGGALALTHGMTIQWRGVVLNNYQILFVASILLRIAAVVLAVKVLEPSSTGTREVVLSFARATRERVSRWRRAA
jgi:MFS family permease